ncbi:MAG TPA: rhodanese-like domain-containing protein [Candidatus Dormibacteraeota bacterium]|nr:rhodanese-like domain-containing protein [Candidatus Dormibacteraeota bacterium]
MTTISPLELHRKLTGGASAILLDVRTPREFTRAHVPGACLNPLEHFQPERVAFQRRNPGEPLYVLCQSGGRARKAIEKLEAAGVGGCVLVEGGTKAWADAGLPLEKQNSGGMSLERQVRIAAGAIVLTGTLLGVFVHPGFLVLPGFAGAGLVFAGLTDICGMGMLLARMPWNQAQKCGEAA